MIEGIHCKGKRGILDLVKQEEISLYKKQKLADTIGTIKAAITYLTSHLNYTIIAVSICGKKLVYLISSAVLTV